MSVKNFAITLCLASLLLSVVEAGTDDEQNQNVRAAIEKGYLLEDTEVARIKEEIRTRCHLRQGNEASYPWYYHYEVGLAMKKRNDWQRALDSFLVALDQRESPQRLTRVYGMWFVDYFPYYNIGLAHYHLQNWKCAVNSFRLSQMLEDMSPKSPDFVHLREYEEQAEQKVSD